MIRVRPYPESDAERWDQFCDQAVAATFLHTRRFLSYHGDRFEDASLIVEDDKGNWLAILPAARDPQDNDCVQSHPGSTYGGLLHHGRLTGDRMVEIMSGIGRKYHELGYRRLRYKAVPHIYHQAPAQDDLYALFRLGATRYRCDLSSTIDLTHRLPLNSRRRRGLAKARKGEVQVKAGAELLPSLWPVLRGNLERKHGVQPVHSEAEMKLLHGRFPDRIRFVVAEADGRTEAGVVLFISPTVHHAQYIAATERGHELSALDAVFDHCIAQATAGGVRYFDFGVSTEENGTVLNEGLCRFKSEFGASGVVYEFYELDLTRAR